MFTKRLHIPMFIYCIGFTVYIDIPLVPIYAYYHFSFIQYLYTYIVTDLHLEDNLEKIKQD